MRDPVLMKSLRRSVWIAVLAVGLFSAFFPNRADAIPAFARTVNAPCVMCHTGFPKLNAFGFVFKQGGIGCRRSATIPGSFFGSSRSPLGTDRSLRAHRERPLGPGGDGNRRRPRSERCKTEPIRSRRLAAVGRGDPRPADLFLGILRGTIPGLEGETTGTDDPDATDLKTEVFVVQVNDLLPDSLLNLRIGKDHIDNYFLSSARRLTRADYLIQIQPVLGASLRSWSVGTEVNGFHPIGLRYAAGVRNFSPEYNSKNDNEQRIGAAYAWVSQTIRHQAVSLIVNSDRVGDANLGTDASALGYGASLNLYVLNAFNIVPGVFWYREGGMRTAGEISKSSAERWN
ncbi:MAG: hypothetical protein MPW17_02510 [Candidatus Manganitrophus sp.]|nr:hypothetical protein [Candidatus Manganitrophus sp.]WDT71735.1 MAG: hypothetical protein MPW17_02510 [Candidatus Manganitrophus sp.]